MEKIAVISLGSVLRCDDNIANLVLDELKAENILLIKGGTNPENFIGPLEKFKPDIIFFIDAIYFNGKAGDVKVFQINDILNLNISTHNLPVTLFKDFFPKTIIEIIGIQPKKIDLKSKISKGLEERFEEIVETVRKIVFDKLK